MDFESSESFANRRKTFLDFCISHWEEYRKKENIGIKRTFYCDTCGADITSENPKCNKCGADNEERIKKLRKFEENEKWIKSSEQLSSSAILAATTAKRGSRAERVRRQQSINIRNTANSADRMTKAKIKLIIGETHEGKLGWIKTQLDLKRTVTEIADDLDESMIRVAKYVDEIVKQDKTED